MAETFATERGLFLWAGGARTARRGMRTFVGQVEDEGASPWADAERLRPLQQGSIDLGAQR